MAPTTISIVDADPELADLLDDEDLQRARHEALTRTQRLSPGDWDVSDALEPDVHHRGFLVVDGLLSREVDVLGRSWAWSSSTAVRGARTTPRSRWPSPTTTAVA